MDILSGMLSGGAHGAAVTGPYIADKTLSNLLTFAKLRDVEAFKRDLGDTIQSWKNSQKAEGVAEIYYPGELEYLHRKSAEAQGVKLADETLSNLLTYAKTCGLTITAEASQAN